MPRLVLLRHAEAAPFAGPDHERPLTADGHAQAAAVGAWLRDQGVTPDHALVSDAQRTRETWADVAAAAGWGTEPELDAGLYSAGPESALDLVHLVDAGTGTLLVLGHNPTIHYLAQVLCDDEGDVEAQMALLHGFAPSSAVIFDVDVAWDRLVPGTATLRAYRSGAS